MSLETAIQTHLGTTYAIQTELQGGGMSRVWIADDVSLNRKVVIKVLNPALAATVSIQRFQREIMVVAKLNHPNIVPILSAGEVDGLPYFIMPYIEGESLRGRIVRGPLSLRETVAILKDVSRALAYSHSQGIVHRDMKPDNVLLAGTAAVVTDFGVAKAVSAARDRGVAYGQTITGVGISLGTPQYMAPEQAAADPNADHRVDIYALGIVAYEMLVGSPPFHGRTPQALLAAQLTELPPPLSSRRYDVPVALNEMVMQCLEKDPADRPKSAQDLVRILESPEAISGPVAMTKDAQAKRRWNTVSAVATTSLGVTALAALVVWSLWPDRSASTATPAGVSVPAATAVRVPRATAIGAQSGDIASAITASLQTALTQAGMRVLTDTGAPLPSIPGAAPTLLLETTVQRAGDRARAQVRLTRGDSSLWADQVDFRVADSFAAQDTVVARVLRAVRAAQ